MSGESSLNVPSNDDPVIISPKQTKDGLPEKLGSIVGWGTLLLFYGFWIAVVLGFIVLVVRGFIWLFH
jgi:hypothetical protein